MPNNKRLGNQYESKLAKLFQQNGYWCHIFAYTSAGQPCDAIAIKGNKVFIVDAKHTKNDTFKMERVEPNQWTTMKYAKQCEIENVGLAIYSETLATWFYVDYEELCEIRSKSIKLNDSVKRLEDLL